ncbi:MAG: hypothetical protein ACI9R3_000453 [Verrucomicrobiales bacterium]
MDDDRDGGRVEVACDFERLRSALLLLLLLELRLLELPLSPRGLVGWDRERDATEEARLELDEDDGLAYELLRLLRLRSLELACELLLDGRLLDETWPREECGECARCFFLRT